MTLLEILLLLILVAVVLFVLYYFLKGSSGRLSFTRPVGSRVDEYLDQRFEELIAEWALVRAPNAQRFRERHEPVLADAESRVAELQNFEKEITKTLDNLEARLAALEKELEKKAGKGPGTGA